VRQATGRHSVSLSCLCSRWRMEAAAEIAWRDGISRQTPSRAHRTRLRWRGSRGHNPCLGTRAGTTGAWMIRSDSSRQHLQHRADQFIGRCREQHDGKHRQTCCHGQTDQRRFVDGTVHICRTTAKEEPRSAKVSTDATTNQNCSKACVRLFESPHIARPNTPMTLQANHDHSRASVRL
jgi:hypothetical protein